MELHVQGRTCRNFSNDAISMILSSTGLEQSTTKVVAFFRRAALTIFARPGWGVGTRQKRAQLFNRLVLVRRGEEAIGGTRRPSSERRGAFVVNPPRT